MNTKNLNDPTNQTSEETAFWKRAEQQTEQPGPVARAPEAPSALALQAQELDWRLQSYFGNGGLFNPELMEHMKVRDLLRDLHGFVREVKSLLATDPAALQQNLSIASANSRRNGEIADKLAKKMADALQAFLGDGQIEKEIAEARAVLAEYTALHSCACTTIDSPTNLFPSIMTMKNLQKRMEEARQYAAQCWCDDETKDRVMDPPLAEAIAKRIASWMSTADEMHQNMEYYRGLVLRCGNALGESARTADDGSKSQDVLCAKVPELVEALCAKGTPRRVILSNYLRKELHGIARKVFNEPDENNVEKCKQVRKLDEYLCTALAPLYGELIDRELWAQRALESAKTSINDLLVRLTKTENVSEDETWSQRNNRNERARIYAGDALASIEAELKH